MEQNYPIKHRPLFDRVLVKAIQTGGEVRNAAWDYIFHYWTDYFVGTIRRNGGTEADARELIGEVFEPVEHALQKDLFRYEAPFQMYMNRAVLNKWYAHLRVLNKLPAAKVHEAQLLQAEFENLFIEEFELKYNSALHTEADEPADEECFELALEALRQNIPLKHQILMDFQIHGFRQRKIADKYNLALQTVKNYVHDAKFFIKDWFKRHPDCMD